MRTVILLPLLLVACSDPVENGVAPVPGTSPLIGLYERAGVPHRPSQICITGEGAETRFGLNSSYEGPQSCTAKGRVTRAGSVLTFLIEGDPACSLKARLTPTGLALDKPQGAECDYYCARDTELEPGLFEKMGNSRVEARKAVDLVGEPLC